VERGESFTVKDYIAPPKILSSESNVSETTWSAGEYVNGRDIWKAFKLPGAPPRPAGVFLNQPSPYLESAKGMWRLCWTFLLSALVIVLASFALARDEEVFSDHYVFHAGAQPEASFVTRTFELQGGTSNVEVDTTSDLSNSWAYFNYALINQDTGQAFDFGREISYYSGSDSDGSWTEGSKNDSVTAPSIPAGHYYLRVEPEVAPDLQAMGYSIRVRRDVPSSAYFWVAVILLLIPPALGTYRAASFEGRRWAESDYGEGSD